MLINKSSFNIPKTYTNYKMNSSKNIRLKILIYAFYIILIDQLTKFLVLFSLGFEKSINIIPSLLNLTLVKNKGAAFSLFSNATTFLTITSIVASLLLITLIYKSPPRSYWNSIGIAYLLGGTIGNGLDRLFKGFVLDFLEIVPINFPIFNLADVSINIAIVCFIIDTIKTKDKSITKN